MNKEYPRPPANQKGPSMLCSGPESHTKAQPDAGGISIEEQIAAVQSALHWRDSVGLAINKDSETGRENEARIAALRAAIATLEAQRWRPIEEAPQDGRIVLVGEPGWKEGEPAFWHDGADNYWKLAGWYAAEDRGTLLTAKPMACSLYRHLPEPQR